MTVYIIRRKGDDSGLVKIGYTKNLDGRLYDMSTSTPEGLEVVHEFVGGRKLERHLHAMFSAKRQQGEWFCLSQEDFDLARTIGDGAEPEPTRMYPTPVPEDEESGDIVKITRFYLNELVKREWRGMGDTVEAARDRVMARISHHSSYGFRIWSKPQELSDVSGEAYRCLLMGYLHALHSEGKLQERHERMIKTYVTTYRQAMAKGEEMDRSDFGTAFIMGLIDAGHPGYRIDYAA